MGRTIHLSAEGQALRDSIGLNPAIKECMEVGYGGYADAVIDRSFRDIDEELVEEFVESEVFKKFSLPEKARSLKALHMIDIDPNEQTGHWLIPSEDLDQNALFEVPSEEFRIPVNPHDSLLLSGAVAVDLLEVSKGLLNQYAEAGFATKLQFAVFAGACLIDAVQKDTNIFGGSSFSTSMGNRLTYTTVGGDMHGDFRMSQHTTSSNGSVTPFGDNVHFAPVEEIIVGAYHSVEPLVLNNVFEHILKHLGAEALHKISSEVLDSLEKNHDIANPTRGNFGDWGASSQDYNLREAAYMVECLFSHPISNKSTTLSELIVLPMQAGSMLTSSIPDCLSFTNNNSSMLSEGINSIKVTNDMLIDFIITLVMQTSSGAGRTSPPVMITMLREAFDRSG